MVKFIGYSGRYPNLCSGELFLEIDGKAVVLESGCMSSGGSVGFTPDWDEVITSGEWSVSVPKEYSRYEDEINRVVNDNVPWGCCGGCV